MTDRTFDLDAVEVLLRDKHGMTDAYVEHTGGGTATLFGGGQRRDEHGDLRWGICAGPGWFDPPMGTPGGCRSYATLDEFYVGPDDDGDTPWSESMEPLLNGVEPTPEAVADFIAAALKKHANA
jgi:hypothetical protein